MKAINAETADQAWIYAAEGVLNDDQADEQSSRAGATRELGQVVISIADPRQRWCITRHPGINPAFAVAEVVWILCGRNDASFLNFWNSQLPKFAGEGLTYHGAYGNRLRIAFGVDQLDRAYNALKSTPDSRQVILQIWNATADLPQENGSPQSPDIPCNLLAMLKIRNGHLTWSQVMRSNDVYRGLPYNLVQFTTVQEVLAGWLGVEVGAYTHFADSLHAYEVDVDAIRESTSASYADPLNAINHDRLDLPKKDSDAAMKKMELMLEEFVRPEFSSASLMSELASCGLPHSFQNLIRLPAAELARRQGWHNEMRAIMSDCSNPALVSAWNHWLMGRGAITAR